MKTLGSLFAADITPSLARVPVTVISIDSRTTSPGDLFFALPGSRTDGHRYIREALDRGAAAVIHSTPIPGISSSIQVRDARRTLSRVSSLLYDNPSSLLHCIGVTGTNGKTTSCAMLFTMLNQLGYPCGIISGYWRGTPGNLRVNDSPLSTPEAPDIHRMLREFIQAGCTHAVIEITSHALAEQTCRVEDLKLSRCIFTPFGRDHLDFHGDEHRYLMTKLHMIDLAPEDAPAVCASDSRYIPYLKSRKLQPVYYQDQSPEPGGVFAANRSSGSWTLTGGKRELKIFTPFTQPYLQENAALCAAGIWDLIPEGLKSLDLSAPTISVPGRGEVIPLPGNRRAVIDYAHNPLGFNAVLRGCRNKDARLLVLFGAAGRRDRGKRPLMAAIADTLADTIILTEEDPFDEPPIQIFSDLLEGISQKVPGTSLFVFPRRESAIAFALSRTLPGDTLLLLGKGHENTLRGCGKTRPWNDRDTVLRIADQMNWV